jgi:hypothetical protein
MGDSPGCSVRQNRSGVERIVYGGACRSAQERIRAADYLTMPVASVDQRDAEQRRLAAESEELLRQSSVLANPQSEAFRDYLDRLYLHTTRLVAFISVLESQPSTVERRQ